MSVDREQVDMLLAKYERYKELAEVEASLSYKVVKKKLTGIVDRKLLNTYDEAKRQLQSLSDSMTFANPIVWMMYKFEAYKNEPQAIRTLQDFRVHCSKEGYICTKRFKFLNDWLVALGEPSLADRIAFEDTLLLNEIYDNTVLEHVSTDPRFMNQWSKYEFYTIEGKPAKWENYPA